MEEDHPQQAHLCLRIMLELYKRGVWCDERPVNVISNACFSQHNKVMVAAIHFFLGSHMSSSGEDKEEVDSDEEGAGGSSEHVDVCLPFLFILCHPPLSPSPSQGVLSLLSLSAHRHCNCR